MRPSAPDRSARATRALARAVERGHLLAVMEALERRADANALVSLQIAPNGPRVQAPVLFLALQRGDAVLVEMLVQARASLDARVLAPGQTGAGQGYTVLDVVQRAEDLLILLPAGLLLHQPNGSPRRDMVLHVAAERGWGEAIAWVARRCESMDVRNALGETPLHAAVRSPAAAGARWRRQEAIRELVAAGASLTAVDTKGQTPAQVAAVHCPDMLPVLAQVGADVASLPITHSAPWQEVPLGIQQRIFTAVTLRRQQQERLKNQAIGRIRTEA